MSQSALQESNAGYPPQLNRSDQRVIERLQSLVPGGVALDVDLARVSRWKVGGSADCIVCPSTADEVSAVISFLRESGIASVVLGSTTNLLFSDDGLRAVGVHIGARLARLRIDGDRVFCEAGHYVPLLARRIARAGLAGAEHTAGIPGTLGGLVCMNGGSQRRGIGENVVSVTSVDEHGKIRERGAADCAFAYRHSDFQINGETIVSAELRFPERGVPTAIRAQMLAILRDRRRKFPQRLPNCGSVFVSDPAMYADFGPPGAVIERLGLKGRSIGGAQVSNQHANFIVNTGLAKASDVIALVTEVRDVVRKMTGYSMRSEGKFVRPDGRIVALC